MHTHQTIPKSNGLPSRKYIFSRINQSFVCCTQNLLNRPVMEITAASDDVFSQVAAASMSAADGPVGIEGEIVVLFFIFSKALKTNFLNCGPLNVLRKAPRKRMSQPKHSVATTWTSETVWTWSKWPKSWKKIKMTQNPDWGFNNSLQSETVTPWKLQNTDAD